jgi:hypothetical protein
MREALRSRGSVVENASYSENQAEERMCLFFPGLSATKPAMHAPLGIHNALEGEYGPGNVITFSSAVSSDKPDRDHFSKMADAVMRYAKSGPVDIVMHSLGMTEFLYVKKIIKKRDRNFFRDPRVKENIHFVKIGESGSSKGISERFSYLREVMQLNAHVEMKTIYAFPPDGVSPSQVNEIFPGQSNKVKGFRVAPFSDATNNHEFLSEQEIATKAARDAQIRAALAKKDFAKARAINEQRSEELRPAVHAVFEGSPSARDAKKKRIKLGGFRGLRLLLTALGNRPRKFFQKLKDIGYRVSSLVPELDPIVDILRSSEFYKNEQDARKHIRVVESSPHDGIALQGEKWAKDIRDSRELQAA